MEGWLAGEAREEPEVAETRDVMMGVTREEQKVVEARVMQCDDRMIPRCPA